ncbi:MAG: hypothetical protein J0H98_05445 [Solirubrobacterales bacterium]|nr:hypothetical protein [Solirubrobacterales bacterium]
MAEADTRDQSDSGRDEVTDRDLELAEEIARFVAERAFAFDDHECRAWALTDFEVWATLAGKEPALRLIEEDQDSEPPPGGIPLGSGPS